MRRRVVLAIVLLTMCGVERAIAQRGGAPKAPEKTPLSTASGKVRVVGEPGLTTSQFVMVLIETDPTLTTQAIKEVSPDAAKSGEHVADVEWEDIGLKPLPGIVTLWLDVKSFDERVPAQKLLEKLRRILASRLPELNAEHRVDEIRQEDLRWQLERLRNELEKQKESCRALAKVHKVPPNAEVGAQQRARLDAQIETISVELEGLVARREVLQSLISEVGKRGAEQAASDPVVAELEQAVALRAEIVKRMRESKAPSVEILAAESQLAEHKAELAKIRRDVAQATGGQRLAELVRRLEDSAVDQAEATARSKALTRMRDSIGSSTELELRQLELAQTESAYREVAKELDRLQRRLQLYQPPTVTLLPAE